MTLYEQIMVVIFLGLFWMVAVDLYQSAKARKFYKEGYEEEKEKRKEYRAKRLQKLEEVGELVLTYNGFLVSELKNRIEETLVPKLDKLFKESNKDAASIKRRQTWSKKREKKDLKAETKKMILVHTKSRKHRK